MRTLTLETDDWPDKLEEALQARADMHRVKLDDLIAEILTAFIEKREPEFRRRLNNCADQKSL